MIFMFQAKCAALVYELEIQLKVKIRAPKDGERYFALLKIETINFEEPQRRSSSINFDNLTLFIPKKN